MCAVDFVQFCRVKPLSSAILNELGHNPTTSQVNTSNALADFFEDPEVRVFILNGYAGTGKTTLLSSLIRVVKRAGANVVLLAPTGRAAKVLTSYSGYPASTIHRKIYKVDEDSGRFELRPSAHSNTLFIVDEASMVGVEDTSGQNLLEDLFAFVFSGINSRLIFSGDLAQLPPVGLIASPALNPGYIRQTMMVNVTASVMDDVVRQEQESGILYNATVLREMIRQKSEELPRFKLSGFSDVVRVSGYELQDHLESAYSTYDWDNTLFICRSNKRAFAFNQQIRTRVRWQEDTLSAGEKLMCVKNNYYWINGKGAVSFIANGDMLQVNRVGREEARYGFNFISANVTFTDIPGEPILDVQLLTDVIAAEAAGLNRDQHRMMYENAMIYMKESGKSNPYKALKMDEFYNALHVKYAYAVTCHKAQGGQWKAVFIDAGYLTKENTGFEYLRWLYTALTRATERVYLVNFPDEMFED